jgi:hypothetical protein
MAKVNKRRKINNMEERNDLKNLSESVQSIFSHKMLSGKSGMLTLI